MSGRLADFSIDQAAGAAALVLGSLGGLLLICFKSRCTQISVLWGCYTCTRVVNDDSDDDDIANADIANADRPVAP